VHLAGGVEGKRYKVFKFALNLILIPSYDENKCHKDTKAPSFTKKNLAPPLIKDGIKLLVL